MIDAVKDYLAAKRFGNVAYLCVIVHFLCGLALSAFTTFLRITENAGKFFCSVDAKSTATYKKQVDQVCFARYDQAYNSPLPLCGFVPLSIGVTILVSVIYSLIVSTRVDEIESRHKQEIDGEAVNHGQNMKTVYVFYSYFVHLVLRGLFVITLTVLQHTYFYPNGFNFKFNCNLPPTDQVTSNINTSKNAGRNLNGTLVTCENATASEKWVSGIFVSVINSIVAAVILGEVIYLLPRLPILNRHSGVGWSCDSKFVIEYFLGKQYHLVGESEPLTGIEGNPTYCSSQDCIDFYKKQVLNRSRDPGIIYGRNGNINDLYIDVVIHTERAQHNFPEEMKRHEIYDVYMKVPPTSICLERIDELFYPNRDTMGEFPRSILAIGRPGIGKTVLTEKILRDWADGIDEYYCDKIVFFFKFRWFNKNINKLANISLKAFLRSGTGLSEEKFESIYEEIAKEPQKAILIFDGLDEYHGDPISCLDQSRIIPNDPNTGTTMNLFIKLVLGDLLKGATVVVTSRPTADDFYSRLDFDRNVEIIGFTSDKIEEYVSRFCDNNDTSDLKTKIWNHIKSSSELLNLCYIPVNCFVVCVTFSGCLSDPRNKTGALPTTLTELYQTAIDHFEKHHHRNADRKSMAHEALKKLQRLAFLGMESGQLIFDQVLFDEEMKKSGLLNSLSNPIFPLQTQFCFIHLTIQEFLAARHVTETLTPPEIEQFILDYSVESGKWHLVFQFIAGLLGKKIKNFDREYKDCIFVFAESLEVTNGIIQVEYHEVFIMKCLREADNEEITKEICETTAINDTVQLHTTAGFYDLSPSEWVAVTYICKHMKRLANLRLSGFAANCLPQVLGLLRKRCLNKLEMFSPVNCYAIPDVIGEVFSALMELNCTFDHEHTKLTSLTLTDMSMTEAGLPIMCKFFEKGHASQLKQLNLLNIDGILSHEISKLCEVLNNGHCPNLTHLDLGNNSIRDEGAIVLYDTLTRGLRQLYEFHVSVCELTDRCIPTLVKALQDERCQLNHLSLGFSAIGDKGACRLFEDALTKEHCKLTVLNLERCSLTDQCIPSLCKALQDERCQLTDLSLENNAIGDEGVGMLFEDALAKEHCKLMVLNLGERSLTDRCIPSLCKALQDERCQLTVLSLGFTAIGDKGVGILFEDALTKEHCKLIELNLEGCWLTDQCLPSLRKALPDEHCKLTKLWLRSNTFTAYGERLLDFIKNYKNCEARGLQIIF